MSKISEYLKLIPKGLPNSISIIQGIVNNVQLKYGTLPEEAKDEIVRRRICCTTCPFNNTNAQISEEYFNVTTTHYKTKRTDFHCAMCSCPLEIRTASLYANCGIESWNEDHPLEELELKWKAIL